MAKRRVGREKAEGPEELGPLLGGHHGLSREQILESQRERLFAAMAQEVADRGYRGLAITRLTKSASVSTRDFYEHFGDKEECFLATFEAIRDHLAELIEGAVASEREWPDQVVAALEVVVEFFAAEPELARLFLLESMSATPAIGVVYREAVLALVPALAAGRSELPDPESLPPEAEGSIIGGAVSILTRKITAGEADQLLSLLPDLIEFTLSPYIGFDRSVALAADFASN